MHFQKLSSKDSQVSNCFKKGGLVQDVGGAFSSGATCLNLLRSKPFLFNSFNYLNFMCVEY